MTFPAELICGYYPKLRYQVMEKAQLNSTNELALTKGILLACLMNCGDRRIAESIALGNLDARGQSAYHTLDNEDANDQPQLGLV